MNAHDQERMKNLLRRALPPAEGDDGPARDLWPDVLRRLNEKTAVPASSGWACFNSFWFDGALLDGLVGLAAIFPSAIPVFLYYL